MTLEFFKVRGRYAFCTPTQQSPHGTPLSNSHSALHHFLSATCHLSQDFKETIPFETPGHKNKNKTKKKQNQ